MNRFLSLEVMELLVILDALEKQKKMWDDHSTIRDIPGIRQSVGYEFMDPLVEELSVALSEKSANL